MDDKTRFFCLYNKVDYGSGLAFGRYKQVFFLLIIRTVRGISTSISSSISPEVMIFQSDSWTTKIHEDMFGYFFFFSQINLFTISPLLSFRKLVENLTEIISFLVFQEKSLLISGI